MTSEDQRPGSAAELRSRAEAIAREQAARSPEDLQSLSPEETRRALQELRVHQIELEMQNEELRRAQAELVAARGRYFDLYDLAPVGYCTLSEPGLILEANLTAATLLGMARGDLVTQRLSRFILKEDEGLYYRHRKRLFDTGEPIAFELRMVRLDGTAFWAHLAAAAGQDAGGAPVCRVTLSDRPERERTEQALRTALRDLQASHAQYEQTVSMLSDVVWRYEVDAQGRFVSSYVSPVADRLFGLPAGTIGDDFEKSFTLVHPDDLAAVQEALFEGLRTKRNRVELEYRMIKPDGTILWVRAKGSACARDSGGIVGYGSTSDITERKRVEEALRQRDALFSEMLRHSPIYVYIKEVTPTRSVVLRASDNYRQLIGFAGSEMIGKSMTELFPADVAAKINADDWAVVSSGKALRLDDEEMNGRSYSSIKFPVALGDTAVLAVFTIDITERKRAEEALRRREWEFSTLVENAPDMIVRFDTDLRHVYGNAAVERHWGVPAQTLIGKTPLEIGGPREQAEFACRSLRQALETGEEQAVELSIPFPSGQKHFATQIVPERDEQGNIRSLLAITRDITERKRVEEALRERHARLEETQRLAKLGSWSWDMATDTVTWSEELFRIAGRDPAGPAPTYAEHHQVYTPESFARLSAAVDRALALDEPYELDLELVRLDGAQRGVTARGGAVRDAAGRVVGLHGMLLDITERKRAEEALRESEERFRSVYEDATLGLYRTTPDGRILLANPALVRMLGYASFEELVARDLEHGAAYEPGYSRAEFLKRIDASSEIRGLESGWRRKDGTTLTVRENARAVRDASGRLLYCDGVVEDITERKRAEEALHASEELFRVIALSTPDSVLVQDRDLRYEFVLNPGAGRTPEEMVGRTDLEIRQPDEAARLTAIKRQVLDTGQPVHLQLPLIGVTGEVEVFEGSYLPRRGADGQTDGLLGYFSNVTERTRTLDALRQAEERLAKLNKCFLSFGADALANINLLVALCGEVMGATCALYNRLQGGLLCSLGQWRTPPGYRSADQPEGHLCYDVIRQADDKAVIIRNLPSLPYAQTDPNVGLYQLKTYIGIAVKCGRGRVGSLCVVFQHDVIPSDSDVGLMELIALAIGVEEDRRQAEEEKEALEAQNRQLHKADSLGRMAGAIAHHYNNLLGAVLLNLELAQGELPSDAGARKYLADATMVSQRAAEISQQMLAYLGQERGRRVPMDLSDTCREVLPLLRAALPRNARLKTEFPVEGAVVRADALQMRRVLTYLAANAGEAIGDGGGSVTVAVDVIPATDVRAARFFPAGWEPKAETYACLSVADTGCGMTPEILDKAFDPFFSTKFTGRGLGLPVVMGIVMAHEGACAAESSPDLGTTLRVYLPCIAEQPRQSPKAKPVEVGAVVGRGLVLVVEDEPMLRDLTRTVLENIGYQVLEAADGAAAVEVFRQRQDQVRCVLCDMTMPGMDGWATLQALRGIRPDVVVILTSGYDEAQVMAGELAERPQGFLHKPYASADLEAALAAALKER